MIDTAAIRSQFPAFACQPRPFHYLDSAATAQILDCVLDALREHDLHSRANVMRGNHRLAELATSHYEDARGRIAASLGASGPDEIVFTSGTTAAINLVAHGLGRSLGAGDEIVVSLAEHHSNFLPWQRLQDSGAVFRVLPVLPDGRIDSGEAHRVIGPRCRLVAVTQASNVTGAMTDLAPILRAARAVGARVLLDGAQAMQHGLADVQLLGADFYTFSGHKCFGPTGVGVLWGRRDALADLAPFMTGGGMVERVTVTGSSWAPPPRRFEAGTPPIAQAVGLAAALDWMGRQDWDAIHAHEARVLGLLLDGLACIPGLRILGPTERQRRLPVVTFSMGDLHAHDICQVLDSRGLALRGGHHCAQPLMDHFGVTAAARASLALYNDVSDVDTLLEGLEEARKVLM